MTLCINHQPGSFSDRWIRYCLERNIPFRLVNVYDTNIIEQLKNCTGLLWHWDLNDYRSVLLARQLTFSLEKRGIRVFPNSQTGWHYDDKIGQKYLLEAVDAPLVKSYVFYNKKDALAWVNQASFPKVFKLRCGSGSANVRLVKNKSCARKLIRQAFGSGFCAHDPIGRLKERFWIFKRDHNLKAVIKIAGGVGRLFIPREVEKFAPKEMGYVYFQDFIPGNTYDIRLIVVGKRCFGLRRYCRSGDFRASGSGMFSYMPDLIDLKMVRLSFDVAQKLKTQSVAFDLINDRGILRIIEISYCYTIDCCDRCAGYWDSDLKWNPGSFEPQEFILDDFLKSLQIPAEKQIENAKPAIAVPELVRV